ncbi:hypothetical protein AB0L25_39545 [Spirillospora sp. NPDC052242]
MAGHDTVREVVIVGGGAAGLSAALTPTRARRGVRGVDAGEPRNAPADVEGAISRLEVDGDRVSGVRLAGGRLIEVDVAVVTGRTGVPGVWGVGNAAGLSGQVSAVAAEGARVARRIDADLVMEDAGEAAAVLGREGAHR